MAVLLATALRGVRVSGGGRPRAVLAGGAAGTTLTLTFASATTDSDGGVYGVVGSTNANQAFSFTEVTPRVGLPRDLEISESGTLRLVITFPADYDGLAYVYTDRSGGTHAGAFPVGGSGTANY